MTNQIVTVNVTQNVGATPSTLQRTGAFISQGATNTTPGTRSLVTQPADLTPLLLGSKPITSISVSGGTATVTTTTAHGFMTGDSIELTIAGATVAAFNGTFLCTITGASAFTYTTIATGSAAGTLIYTVEDVTELLAGITTFYAQGSSISVYVLELGPGNASDGVAYLTTWLVANPGVFYGLLVPTYWDANPNFLNLIAAYEALNAKLYFWVTTTLATRAAYTALMKDVFALIETPSYGAWQANFLTAISYTASYGANVLTAIVWASTGGGTVTATTTTAHGVTVGNQFSISGCTPAGYNGTFTALAGTTGSTLVYALAVNPGAESALGTLVAAAFGGGSATTTIAHGVVPGNYFTLSGTAPIGYNGTFLALPGTTGSTLIFALSANPGSETVLGTLVASYNVSAGTPSTELTIAATFYDTLNYNPSSTNKVTPLAFSYQFGVTPFPIPGNAAILTALQTQGINFIDTGSEGGVTNTILKWGTTMDVRPFNYWYSADWTQINVAQALANEIINGSNDPINPLYLNQDGINRLQARAAQTMGSGVTFGLVLGTVIQTELNGTAFAAALSAGTFAGKCVVNAVPFVDYYTANPGDYKIGVYNGLSITYIPLRGFEHILVNVNVSDFVTA